MEPNSSKSVQPDELRLQLTVAAAPTNGCSTADWSAALESYDSSMAASIIATVCIALALLENCRVSRLFGIQLPVVAPSFLGTARIGVMREGSRRLNNGHPKDAQPSRSHKRQQRRPATTTTTTRPATTTMTTTTARLR